MLDFAWAAGAQVTFSTAHGETKMAARTGVDVVRAGETLGYG